MHPAAQPTISPVPSYAQRFRTERAKLVLAEHLKATVKNVMEREKQISLAKHLINADLAQLQHALRTYSADVRWLQNAIRSLSNILTGAEVVLYCNVIPVRSSLGVRDVALVSISSVRHKKMISISSDPNQGVGVYTLPVSECGFQASNEEPSAVLNSIASLIVDFFNQPESQLGAMHCRPDFSNAVVFA